MRADQLIQLVTQILFVLIFAKVGYTAFIQRRRFDVDTSLLFGLAAVLIAEGWISELVGGTPRPLIVDISSSLLLALPYSLLRLVEDFSDPPRLLSRAATVGLGLCVVSLFVVPSPYPNVLILLYLTYFVGLVVYAAWAFMRADRRSHGVTKRRMQAVALGSLLLGGAIAFAGMQAIAPSLLTLWGTIANLLALACGLAYYVGFAPPGWLRRAWQVPELRGFLIKAAVLPRLGSVEEIVRALETGAAQSLGTERAAIGLWDEMTGKLHYEQHGNSYDVAPEQYLGGRAFLTQRPVFTLDTLRDDPEHAPEYERYESRALLAAPITAGERRLGVLAVYASHAPVFAEDDLVLLTLLANQAAVVLESRELIDKEARVRVREEITHLKDEFLSAAAHDLKTPLTTLVAQAQLLAQRATRFPEAPPDMAGIERIVVQAKRLKSLVLELLDVSRVEQGRLVGRLESINLISLAEDACARHTTSNHQCTLSAPSVLIGMYDGLRIEQLFDNLLENAVKYNPTGGEVQMVLRHDGNSAHVSVSDTGIGIAAADLPHLFDRFFRGENLNDRQFAGLGLGLFICAGIVEQHGGKIWATSDGRGTGSTFHVVLPLVQDNVLADQDTGLDRRASDDKRIRAE